MFPILDLYYGDHLATVASKGQISFFDGLFSSNYVYIIGAFIFFYILFLLFFFIIPLFKKNPLRYYKRYLEIRTEIQKIDDLYNKRKINFEDYSYAQFNYAKEYENIVTFLSKYPEYKERLESYRLEGPEVESTKDSFEEKQQQKKINQINYLTNLLLPKAKYYREQEVEQAILDEGFTKEISVGVINKLEKQGVVFGSETREKTNRLVNLVNKIMPTKEITETSNMQNRSNENTIDLRNTVYTPKQQNKNYVNQINYSETKETQKEKENIFGNLKNLLSSKKKNHSISEINDIFKDIEQSLKTK